MASTTPSPEAARLTADTSLLQSVIAGIPGGRAALAVSMVTLVGADLAILWSIESLLVDGVLRAQQVVAFLGGGVLASRELRVLLTRMSLATNQAISATVRRLLMGVDRLDLRSFELLGADQIHRRITLESPLVAQAGLPLAASTRFGMRGIACGLYLFYLSPQVASVVTLLLGLVGMLRYAVSTTGRIGMAEGIVWRDRLLETWLSITRGISSVLLHRPRSDALVDRARVEVDRVGALLRQVEVSTLRTEAVAAVLLSGLITLVSVVLGAVDPELAKRVFIVVLFVQRSVSQLVAHLITLERAKVAHSSLIALEKKVLATADARPPVVDIPPITDWRTIGLSGVCFAYNKTEDYSFGPVDLRVNRGEVLFITGSNGSGKSTCLKLLLGLYSPESGTLTFDDTPVKSPAPQAWRDLFSVVLSDFVLFDRLLGLDVPTARANELLEWLDLAGKVRVEDGRFSTLDLSTGQRKRLALIVALLQDREVFVFDEWAADQDPEFRDVYYHRILPDLKRRGKTVICVTHDDQFFHLADRRVIIQAGKVVA